MGHSKVIQIIDGHYQKQILRSELLFRLITPQSGIEEGGNKRRGVEKVRKLISGGGGAGKIF